MDKLEILRKDIGTYRSALIAFSGGVDSTFLARVAGDVLEGRVLLVTAYSSTYPASERAEAVQLARILGLPHRVIVSEETDIAEFVDNPPDRCYYCKRELFMKLTAMAGEEGLAIVFDGSNADDCRDYRPGRKAVSELGVASPLQAAGLTKEDIRTYSRGMGLPTADKPAYACLASRFPYGEKITVEKLGRVGEAEEAIKKLGFTQLRVRSHGDCARIECVATEMDACWQKRSGITDACTKAGFVFVSIDTTGYRTGAMNESLPDALKKKTLG